MVATAAVLAVILAQIGIPTPPLGPPGQQPPPGPAQPQDPGDGFPDVGPALFADDGETSRARDLWGSVDCQRRSRARIIRNGGDSSATADGRAQPPGFRRMLVLDGDDFSGERCELGLNDHRASPVALYHEGERRITFASFRLGSAFPLERAQFQIVMQMKQTQPSDSGGGVPTLALHARNGRWRLFQPDAETHRHDVWSRPARTETWTRFAFDVTYSADPRQGSVRIWADLNGDGDALDPGERSERLQLRTLKAEGPGTDEDGIAEGESIPSHLRVGVYHHDIYRCRRARCTVGVDNVGVYEPPN